MYIQVLYVDSMTIHMAASDHDLAEINKEYINIISTGELKIIWSFNRTQVYVSPAGKVIKEKIVAIKLTCQFSYDKLCPVHLQNALL